MKHIGTLASILFIFAACNFPNRTDEICIKWPEDKCSLYMNGNLLTGGVFERAYGDRSEKITLSVESEENNGYFFIAYYFLIWGDYNDEHVRFPLKEINDKDFTFNIDDTFHYGLVSLKSFDVGSTVPDSEGEFLHFPVRSPEYDSTRYFSYHFDSQTINETDQTEYEQCFIDYSGVSYELATDKITYTKQFSGSRTITKDIPGQFRDEKIFIESSRGDFAALVLQMETEGSRDYEYYIWNYIDNCVTKINLTDRGNTSFRLYWNKEGDSVFLYRHDKEYAENSMDTLSVNYQIYRYDVNSDILSPFFSETYYHDVYIKFLPNCFALSDNRDVYLYDYESRWEQSFQIPQDFPFHRTEYYDREKATLYIIAENRTLYRLVFGNPPERCYEYSQLR